MAIATPAAEVVAVEKSVVIEMPAASIVAKEESFKPAATEKTAILIPDTTKVEAAPPPTSANEDNNTSAVDPVDPEKKALDELKELVHAALANNDFNPPPPPAAPAAEPEPAPAAEPESAPAAELPPPLAAETKDPVAPVKEAPLPPPPAPPAEDKAATSTDDGAKTVEAIAETVIPAVQAVPAVAEEEKAPTEPPPSEPVSIWGVPLLADERSDAVLLKFLRARDFKVKEAFAMLKNTVIWRKQFGVDALVADDELSLPELDEAVFMHGKDREGHPVCYNVYGKFQDKELYEKTFGDEEKRQKFLKWRIRYLEKGIRELLDFGAGAGVCSMVQVTDMKNSPKHRQVASQALGLLQDNYPEFIAKKVFINVSWWNLDYYRMKISSLFTQRTSSKFVFAGSSKSAETLFEFIAPEQVPIAYGGLSQENGSDFTIADAATMLTIKPSSKEFIEIPVSKASQLVWELRVLGWEVNYGAEFVPSAEDGYTVIVQKTGKMTAAEEPISKGSYKIDGPGKVVLNIENPTQKKKVVLYRYKTKNSTKSS